MRGSRAQAVRGVGTCARVIANPRAELGERGRVGVKDGRGGRVEHADLEHEPELAG